MLAPFNRSPFNRSASIDVYCSFEIDLAGDVSVLANVEANVGFDLDLGADVLFDAVRERLAAFVLDQVSEINFAGVRERVGSFAVSCQLDVSFTAGRMHVDYIEFVGEFKPGDQIVIDSNTLKLTRNGQNALHLMQGDFFDLNTGTNELIYTDDKSGRTVRMRITFKDKFV